MAKLIGTFRDLPHKLHLSSGGKAKASDKQLKQYKEYFDLGELCKIGFPDNATTIAHDTQLNLLAIGTKTGEILVYGAPGHEFSASHKEASEVKQLIFLPDEGRLLSLTADNRLHKWELNESATSGANWRLEHVAELLTGPADGADDQLATSAALVGSDRLWIGYASGSVRLVDAKDWKFVDAATSGEAIDKGLNEEARSQLHGWGSIVAIEASPANGKYVAVGFSSGTVAVLNSTDCNLHSLIPGAAELRCLSWLTDGSAVYTGHADGSYAVWRADEPAETSRLLKTVDNPQTVYGPFPCLPVTRLLHRTAKLGGLTVLAGGMAKNTHADRHTVTLLREQEHVCLDLCSPVVDLVLLCSPGDGNTGQAGYDEPHTLIVLCESQLVALDLYGAQWPEFRLPYLTAISATGAPVSAVKIYGSEADSGVEQIRAALLAASNSSSATGYTSRAWPITGGKSLRAATEEPATATSGDQDAGATTSAAPDAQEAKPAAWHLLVTGHSDGSVAFWQIGHAGSGTSAALLHTLNTAELFSDSAAASGVAEENPADAGGFPPFRSAGRRWRRAAADENAARFAVTTLELAGDCLLVGGAAGQVTMWRLASSGAAPSPVEVDVRTVNADIVSPGKDSPYIWEGQAPLRVREEPWQPPTGRLFEPATIGLVFPPDRVLSLALDVARGLAAVGTGFGLALIDTGANRCLAAHSTLTPPPASTAASHATSTATPAKGAGAAAAPPAHSSGGGSSITKSLRQSFRRLKKLRGGKRQEYTVTTEEAAAEGAGPSTSAEPQAEAATAEETGAADKKKKDKKEKEKEKKKEDKKEKEKKDKKEKKEDEKAEKKEEEKEEKVEEVKEAEKKPEEEPCGSSKAAEAEAETASPAVEQPAPVPEKPKQLPLTSEVAAESHGLIRCLLIAEAHLLTAGAGTTALFAGDRAGRVYAFQVDTPAPAAGAEAAAAAPTKQARLAKELHLRHGAPVVAIHVTGEQQQLVVTSEQQVKLFSLPSLRPRCKARLLPPEDPAKLRTCGLAQFRTAASEHPTQTGLVVEDSLGRLLVLSLPQLKILAQLDRPNAAAASGSLTYQPSGAINPLAVAVAGRSRVRLVRLSAVNTDSGRYVSPAGLELPDWARPAKAAQSPAQQQQQQASSAVSAATGAAAASASPADAAETETAAVADAGAAEHEQAEQDADADHSHHQVVADITLDDIKEYAAAAPLPPTETIPEVNEKPEPAAAEPEEPAAAPEKAVDDLAKPVLVEVDNSSPANEKCVKGEVSPSDIKAAVGSFVEPVIAEASNAAGDSTTEQ